MLERQAEGIAESCILRMIFAGYKPDKEDKKDKLVPLRMQAKQKVVVLPPSNNIF